MANEKTAPAGSPPAAANPKKKYFAHKKLIHDGNVFYPDGQPLPENFPAASVDRLVTEKIIAEKPPASADRETKPSGPPTVVQVEEKKEDQETSDTPPVV